MQSLFVLTFVFQFLPCGAGQTLRVVGGVGEGGQVCRCREYFKDSQHSNAR